MSELLGWLSELVARNAVTRLGAFLTVAALAIMGFTSNLLPDKKPVVNTAPRPQTSNERGSVDVDTRSSERYTRWNGAIFKFGWLAACIGVSLLLAGLLFN